MYFFVTHNNANNYIVVIQLNGITSFLLHSIKLMYTNITLVKNRIAIIGFWYFL